MSKSSDPFYVVTYYIKRVTTSWTCCTLSSLIPAVRRGQKFFNNPGPLLQWLHGKQQQHLICLIEFIEDGIGS